MATEFIQEDLYVGKQILIDSDRLVFNGRDDIVFSSAHLFLFKTEGELFEFGGIKYLITSIN